MKIDAVSAVALSVVIASFAIDRIVRGFLFLLIFFGSIHNPVLIADEQKRIRAEQVNALLYTLLAAVLGLVVLAYFGKIRILQSLGFQGVKDWLDMLVTGLLLTGGAEQIGRILEIYGDRGVEKPAPRPVEVRGTLTLEEETARKILGQGA